MKLNAVWTLNVLADTTRRIEKQKLRAKTAVRGASLCAPPRSHAILRNTHLSGGVAGGGGGGRPAPQQTDYWAPLACKRGNARWPRGRARSDDPKQFAVSRAPEGNQRRTKCHTGRGGSEAN